MTTEYLREFITLAEMGNYNAAAEPLFISEATLSRHIMALEKEIGAELFKRFPRHIELTEAGIVFLAYARQIVSSEDICIASLNHRQEYEKSSIAIGIDKTLSFYHVAEIISAFKETHPEFVIQIVEGDTFSLKEKVESSLLQLAFILDDKTSRNVKLKYNSFSKDRFVAAIPPGHPFTNQKNLHISKLSTENLLMPPRFTAMYELCVKAFRNAGLEPSSTVSAELSGKTAKELIKRGVCTAVLPRSIALAWRDDGIQICDIFPLFEMETAVIHSTKSASCAVRQFLTHLEKVSEQ